MKKEKFDIVDAYDAQTHKYQNSQKYQYHML